MAWYSVPLTAGQKTKLRSGSNQADYLLTLCKNRVVFAAQLNSDLTTPTTWRSFLYHNVTVGAYTDIEPNQVLLMGKANDITKATFRGRVHSVHAPTATTIYCNEASADFVVDDYVWVLDSYDITYLRDRPSTSDPTTAVELIDGDVTYAPPRGEVIGLRTAYVDDVDPGTGKMRVVFDVSSSYPVGHADSITAYQFIFRASTYTVIAGSLASPNVTVDFNPGEQWGTLLMTTDNGQVKRRKFYIFAHDDNNPPDTGFDDPGIEGNLSSGFSMTVPAFTDVDNVLRDTFAVCRRANVSYGGVAGDLDGNNIAFVGWFQREETKADGDDRYSVVEESSFVFTGFGPRMARLTAQLPGFVHSDSPANWGEIVHLTTWRAICHYLDRYTTVTMLADLQFDDKSNAFEFPEIAPIGNNVWDGVRGLCDMIDALCETAPDGRLCVARSAEYLSQAARNALTTVIDYDAQDAVSPGGIRRAMEQNETIGVVNADGGYYNPSTGQSDYFTCVAPSLAQGEAQGSSTLSSQILTVTTDRLVALDEMLQRAADKYEVDNNTEVIEIDHPDGYTYLIPSKSQLYTLTVDQLSLIGVNRLKYDTTTLWMLEAIRYQRQGNGSTGVTGTYRKLSRIGDKGTDTTKVAENSIDDPMTDLGDPAFTWEDPSLTFPDVGLDQVNPAQLAPPAGSVATFKGQELLVASPSGGKVFYLKSVIALKKPISVDITPGDLGSYVIQMVAVSPFKTKTAIPGYFLAYDSGSDKSAVWYNPNIAAPNARENWAKGADQSGFFNIIRTAGTSGTVMIYSPSASNTWTKSYDFTLSDGGWTPYPEGWAPGGNAATYTAGVGWQSVDNSSSLMGVEIQSPAVSTFEVVSVETFYNIGGSTTPFGCFITLNTNVNTYGNMSLALGAHDVVLTRDAAGTTQVMAFIVRDLPPIVGTSWTISKIIISGKGFNPFGGGGAGGSSSVATSSDDGATFAAAVTVSSAGGTVTGFDVQPAGTVSYAAASGAVWKATTLGGSYSSWFSVPSGANPVCIILPWFRRNSTTRNTAVSDPDVIIGCDNGKWYWIDGATATATDITPVASFICSNADALTARWGNELAAWGTVNGVQKVYTSVNGGTSWTFRSNISGAGKIRCRRQDDTKSPDGQIYLMQNDVCDFSSKWFSNALYPRTMPTSGITCFDTVY